MMITPSLRAIQHALEEWTYSHTMSVSVYIGIVRSSIQEKIPFLGGHTKTAILLAVGGVMVIQVLVWGLAFTTTLVRGIMEIPSLLRRVRGTSLNTPTLVMSPNPVLVQTGKEMRVQT